tara:strand:+ start:140 stop:340 length:201 start_codon:yes stop_codon:yes gene_type:complete
LPRLRSRVRISFPAPSFITPKPLEIRALAVNNRLSKTASYLATATDNRYFYLNTGATTGATLKINP